jgi:hypothetical protein
VTAFEFAAFVAGASFGALVARVVGLLPRLTDLFDDIWRARGW